MSGQTIASEFKKAGLKAIKKSSTSIRGYNNFSKGDYLMYTEKSFGLYGLLKHQRARHIQFESIEAKEKAKDILQSHNVPILTEYTLELITTA